MENEILQKGGDYQELTLLIRTSSKLLGVVFSSHRETERPNYLASPSPVPYVPGPSPGNREDLHLGPSRGPLVYWLWRTFFPRADLGVVASLYVQIRLPPRYHGSALMSGKMSARKFLENREACSYAFSNPFLPP